MAWLTRINPKPHFLIHYVMLAYVFTRASFWVVMAFCVTGVLPRLFRLELNSLGGKQAIKGDVTDKRELTICKTEKCTLVESD